MEPGTFKENMILKDFLYGTMFNVVLILLAFSAMARNGFLEAVLLSDVAVALVLMVHRVYGTASAWTGADQRVSSPRQGVEQ